MINIINVSLRRREIITDQRKRHEVLQKLQKINTDETEMS